MYTHEVTTVNHSKQGGNYKRSKVNNVFFSPPRNTLPTLGTTEKNKVNIHRNETAMSNVNTNKQTIQMHHSGADGAAAKLNNIL